MPDEKKRKPDDRDKPGNKKGKYRNSNKGDSDVNMNGPGVMISCMTGKERNAAREIIWTFEELADTMFGKHKDGGSDATAAPMSIADALKAEVEELNEAEKSANKRFWFIPLAAKGLCYIRFLDPTVIPSKLVTALMEKVIAAGKAPSRYCLRLVPVDIACFATAEALETLAKEYIPKQLAAGEAPKFAVVYKSRHNTKLKRQTCIDQAAAAMPSSCTADLNNPEFVILVESTCGISCVRDYYKYKKFNLHELVKPDQKQEDVKKRTSGDDDEQGSEAEIKRDLGQQDNVSAEERHEKAATEMEKEVSNPDDS